MEGAALLDLDEPWRVVARGGRYLLAPETAYERLGDVPNVVFPCAALVDGDRLTLYYEAADTVVCLVHGHLSAVLEHVRLDGARSSEAFAPQLAPPKVSAGGPSCRASRSGAPLLSWGQQPSAAWMSCACEISEAASAVLIFFPVCAFTSLIRSSSVAHAFSVSSATT